MGLADTQRVILILVHGELRVVQFIHRQHDRFAAALEGLAYGAVGPGDFLLPVQHENNHASLLYRLLHLGLHFAGDFIHGYLDDAACVHQAESSPVPRGLVDETVPGDAFHIMYDGALLADNTVEQRGLAHIRAAHYGHHRQAFLGSFTWRHRLLFFPLPGHNPRKSSLWRTIPWRRGRPQAGRASADWKAARKS
ncbi:MAG: hypothetical protein BWX80_03408 [Candidatus Hydrogenedentes bacterium ADurb.Bin101]|nr:MAG: hypothetical protein BWX80_03408 [Candidatus Hydrogenedentes bacterium ADurb.Bin101]